MKGCQIFKILTTVLWLTPYLAFAQISYSISKQNKHLIITSGGKNYHFSGQFSILYSEANPNVSLRPAGIKDVLYNVPSWITEDLTKADLRKSKATNDMVGDGFDDKILKASQDHRTVNLYNPGQLTVVEPSDMHAKGKDSIVFTYSSGVLFDISASIIFNKAAYPQIKYTLTPKRKGYFSVGYTGAPSINSEKINEIWQPLIWQERRFPDNAYLTPSYMATLPTTLVDDGLNSLGVLASPEYLPFDPLPVFANSQFGISVRDKDGLARPQVFAPIFGGYQSLRDTGQAFHFSAYLVVEPQSITQTYEKIARDYFGFKDYRRNDIATLNTAFDNIVDYSLTKYAWFVDSLKGFAYSTDVPGAVKNVSSLNPLELAIVTDNPQIFKTRAYPLLEYMLSREKFLFALDSTQKIQSPSRKLRGPIAPISELVALYNIFNKTNPVYVSLAKKEYASSRVRNLDVVEIGDTWTNSMNLFKATKDSTYFKKAVEDATDYLNNRVYKKQTGFNDEFAGGFFFWPAYTNKWIDLLELYELTGDKKFLTAAHEGARHYTMFTWMSPAIPEDSITVNKGGKAPLYGYLKSKGHNGMFFPEERAPAWRLSEIGLTPESSGTSTGHRAIFMANYAPWMLRLGYYTKDDFLKEIAKAAIVGRYRSFPGYHINTARTTAYEKFNFPLHEHKEQSVNSFHYNHIMPMASILLDYLMTDAYVRSNGEINFPSEFIEGYAYLQSKFYGSKKGNFYNEKNIQLWMPKDLLKTSSIELNYVSGRRDENVFIALMNQSGRPVNASILLNKDLIKSTSLTQISVYENGNWKQYVGDGLRIHVPAHGITTIKMENVYPVIQFQHQVLAKLAPIINDYVPVDMGRTESMLLRLGQYANKAFIYLQDDDSVFSEVRLIYQLNDGKRQSLAKKNYPFEFSIDIPSSNPRISFHLEGVSQSGTKFTSQPVVLGDAKVARK